MPKASEGSQSLAPETLMAMGGVGGEMQATCIKGSIIPYIKVCISEAAPDAVSFLDFYRRQGWSLRYCRIDKGFTPQTGELGPQS